MESLLADKWEWYRRNSSLGVEYDALEVIKLFNGVFTSLSDIQVFIEDIIFVSLDVNSAFFCHVFDRKINLLMSLQIWLLRVFFNLETCFSR